MAKTALITGITGQDGSYLAELLLEKGYEVHGLVRRSSTDNLYRIQHLLEKDRLTLHYGDLTDGGGLTRLVGDIAPEEVYNLAAQSHVKVSFDIPDYTTDVTAVGAVRLLEAIRSVGVKTCRSFVDTRGDASPPSIDCGRLPSSGSNTSPAISVLKSNTRVAKVRRMGGCDPGVIRFDGK